MHRRRHQQTSGTEIWGGSIFQGRGVLSDDSRCSTLAQGTAHPLMLSDDALRYRALLIKALPAVRATIHTCQLGRIKERTAYWQEVELEIVQVLAETPI